MQQLNERALKEAIRAAYKHAKDNGNQSDGYYEDDLIVAIQAYLSAIDAEGYKKMLTNIVWLAMPSDCERLCYIPKESIDNARELLGIKT